MRFVRRGKKMIEKWYWIELIGFDNTLPDYGAESFVSRAGDVYGVSLLFSNVDFVCGLTRSAAKNFRRAIAVTRLIPHRKSVKDKFGPKRNSKVL